MEFGCYDHDWFAELVPIKVSFLRQLHNQVPKDLSIQSQKEIDTLYVYPQIKKNNDELYEKLQILYNKIESDKKKPVPVRDLWLDKLLELIRQVKLLESIYKTNFRHETTDNKQFIEELNSVWGMIDPHIFLLTLTEAKQRLHKRDPNFITSSTILFPEGEYSECYHTFQRVHFDKTVTSQESLPATISLIEFKALIEKTLISLGMEQWRVKFDSKAKFGRFVVLSKSKLIILPTHSNNQDTIRYKRAIKLLHHEIFTHVVRSDAGLNSKLQLLGVGLAGYYKSEEGIATFREQRAVEANKYFSGFLSHLAVGLAHGLDRNGVKRTPLEFVYIFTDVYIQLGLSTSLSHQKAIEKMFRVYIKLGNEYVISNFESIYREGNIKIHKLVYDHPDIEESFNIGKFDPFNHRQIAALTSLGIIT